LTLSETEPKAAFAVLSRALRLRDALRGAFAALVGNERITRELSDPINEVLRITEGHDELVYDHETWKLEFIAREGGLDWLLAAIARSGAEILVEGAKARIRRCANPSCELFFCDKSRTRRRRWCSMAICGNRQKVASFARRRAS
jgi:predicted RNA-binding Zn ribbon-like protein